MGGECLRASTFSNWTHETSQPLVQTPPLNSCEVCIIVPVRDEAETLETTLTALTYQTDLKGQRLDPTRYEIILLANNCSDDSALIARRFAQQHPIALHVIEMTLPVPEAYIGRVRQILMDEAYRRLISLGRKRGVIASTDGDTRVAPTWIAATLYEIACGADAVGGRILTERGSRLALDPYARQYHLREVGYRYLIAELETYLDPDPFDIWPRHYQHYGASLAVTAQMYQQAGGLPPVKTPEDVAFYRALVRVDACFRHSPLVQVFTSARQTGRTNAGLANQLNEWATMGRKHQPFLVESAAAVETHLRLRRQLRVLWWRIINDYQLNSQDIVPLATELGVTTNWLTHELKMSDAFGLLLERIEQCQQETGKWGKHWSLVEITSAIPDLRVRTNYLRRRQHRRREQDHLQHEAAKSTSRFITIQTKAAQTDRVDIAPRVDLLDAVV